MKHLVYLHDTPSKSLFERARRAFSSGCIRIEHPLNLAERLLENKTGWDRAKIEQVVASGKLTRVNLEKPVTVMLLYWTATVEQDGTVRFKKDIYERDAAVLEALNKEFSFRKTPVIQPEKITFDFDFHQASRLGDAYGWLIDLHGGFVDHRLLVPAVSYPAGRSADTSVPEVTGE